MSIEAMKQMVEALEGFYEYGYDRLECYEHITAIKQAIAEAEKQEPVAWLKVNEDSWTISLDAEPDHIPLYAHPQLKAEKQEPVAEVTSKTGAEITMSWWHEPALPIGTKLYTTPQPKQEQDEPVAVVDSTISGHINWLCTFFPKQGTKLYTTPQRRKWVGLTADELNVISDSMKTWNSFQITDVYFAIETKLKEKNT